MARVSSWLRGNAGLYKRPEKNVQTPRDSFYVFPLAGNAICRARYPATWTGTV